MSAAVACLGPEIRTLSEADLPHDALDAITEVVTFEELVARGNDILDGGVRGRVVVDVNA